jgi:hypothetical protein
MFLDWTEENRIAKYRMIHICSSLVDDYLYGAKLGLHDI